MISLTVFFEDPFWIGLYESVFEGRHQVVRRIYGAEPPLETLYAEIRQHLPGVFRHIPPGLPEERIPPLPGNPKRRQRHAAHLLECRGPTTRSREVLAELREIQHRAEITRRREAQALREAQRALLRKDRRRQRRRGH